MKHITVTRTAEKAFHVISGTHIYHISGDPRWACDCPARGMCKHLRTALSCFGLAVGSSVELVAKTDASQDSGLLDGHEFDFEAGCDVQSEIAHIRSGRERRDYGC